MSIPHPGHVTTPAPARAVTTPELKTSTPVLKGTRGLRITQNRSTRGVRGLQICIGRLLLTLKKLTSVNLTSDDLTFIRGQGRSIFGRITRRLDRLVLVVVVVA